MRHRIVKPLGLVLKAGTWYMVALAEDANDARTYRLANILKLSVREGSFKYPKKFQLAAHGRPPHNDSKRKFTPVRRLCV